MLTNSRHYSRRIKRSVQQVTSYLLMRDPRAKVTREQVAACHYFADTTTPDSDKRRTR